MTSDSKNNKIIINKGRRIESPSSINVYKQCPRKYYYQYVLKLPTKKSIHLIRGSVVHSVLEHFFNIDLSDERLRNFKALQMRLFSLFTRFWNDKKQDLESLGLSDDELNAYFDESVMMLQNWFNRFKKKLEYRISRGESFDEAFRKLTPVREKLYQSSNYHVKGFIDVIHEIDGKVFVLDYKTSKTDHVSDAYKLQLAIYALLYEELHGKRPDFVGIDFIKASERLLKVDDDLINHAKFEIEQIHASTASDDINDYPMNPSPLCKWSSGQCDYYDLCFGGLSVDDYKKRFSNK